MKKIIYLILAVITVNFTRAQTLPTKHEWHATLKVIDEAGMPIARANASIGYYTNSIPTSADGLTDTNGIFSASHSAYSGLLGFTAEKPGYYITRKGYDLGFTYDLARWNPTQTITLKKKINPIPMYAKEQELKFPKEDEAIGFDLMAGDWVTPYGKGFHADIYFTVHRKIISERDFDANLAVTFPNKGDGIVVAPSEPDTGSEFKTSRTALENGYGPELALHYSHSERPKSVFGYFIRVRTVLDDDGNVKSALYGKIRGDFRFYAGTIAPTAEMGFDYYLNPTPNDRNLEFDPKKNLVRDLKPLEGVSEP
jgi:hypothetical protein